MRLRYPAQAIPTVLFGCGLRSEPIDVCVLIGLRLCEGTGIGNPYWLTVLRA